MRVLVTGATGFVGRALVAELAARGYTVRLALRRALAPGAWDTRSAGLETAQVGDLGPDTEWTDALADVDAVLHLAAQVHMLGDVAAHATDLYDRINHAGTEQLARAAATAGARRFVFVSTIKVNGEDSATGVFRANDPPHPVDPYAISKWRAEQALNALAARGALEPVILRPPLVYGPGVKANFLALMRAVDRGWPLPLAAVRNRRSLCYVGNLVSAIAAALPHPAAAGRTYLVADAEPIATPELIRRIGLALGRQARLFPVPAALMRLAGRMTGRHEAVERLLGSLAVDDSDLRRDLQWTPPFSLDEGLRATAQWYRTRTDA